MSLTDELPLDHAGGLVIKYGGNAMTDASTRLRVAAAIRERAAASAGVTEVPVVVHGGGPFIAEALDTAGLEHRFARGLRVTSDEAMIVIESVLTALGKRLAAEIGPAVGLSGRDAGLLHATPADRELGRVGHMRSVDAAVIHALRAADLVPVIGCVALDDQGEALNVNADEVAGAVAGALGAGVLFLTNVPGVLNDPDDPESLYATLGRSAAAAMIADGRIAGGMIPKVEAALAALDLGARFAVIADGRTPAAITGADSGTRILPD